MKQTKRREGLMENESGKKVNSRTTNKRKKKKRNKLNMNYM